MESLRPSSESSHENVPHFKTSDHRYWTEHMRKFTCGIYQFASVCKVVPFELVGKEDLRVRKFPQMWKRLVWHGVNLVLTFAFLFQLCSFVYDMATKSFRQDRVVHLSYTLVSAYGWLYMFTLYTLPDEGIMMLNSMDFILKSLKGLGLPEFNWKSNPFIIFSVHYMLLISVGFSIFPATFYMRNPERSCYLYSYLPFELKQSFVVYFLGLLYEFSYMFWTGMIWLIFYIYWVVHMFLMNHVFRNLRKRKHVTSQDVKCYIYLQIYSRIYNNFNGGFFATGFCFIVVINPVAYTFVCLQFFDQLGISLRLLLPFTVIFEIILIVGLLPQGAKIRVDSARYLTKLQKESDMRSSRPGTRRRSHDADAVFEYGSEHSRAFMMKRVEAFTPFGIRIWFFASLSVATSQHMIDQICNNVLLLLSL